MLLQCHQLNYVPRSFIGWSLNSPRIQNVTVSSIGKDSDAGRDWGQEEKGTTEFEMAGWHHGLDGRESE